MAEEMSIDKLDPTKDDSGDESVSSSPEDGLNITAAGNDATAPQEAQQPKRKGGRKPIYATSEERKQRNRQAQAAFRERRTEYIKQLEEAIRTHEQNLATLQAAHRQAADECLMLRYKNSLLERILLEKGIDVKAELRAKTGSPTLPPAHLSHNLVQAPPIQRAILNRHNARRSNSGVAPKLEPGVAVAPLPPLNNHSSTTSPTNRPTPSSHSASPTATTYSSQHGTSPPGSESMPAPIRPIAGPVAAMKAAALPNPQQMGAMSGMHSQRQMHMTSMPQAGMNNHGRGSISVNATPMYPPSFQTHYEQLDQEYNATDNMIDDTADTPETPSGPGPYPGASYGGEPRHMSLSSPTSAGPPVTQHMSVAPTVAHTQHGPYPSMTQLLDASYDADPFGLNASMAFPQFSFDASSMR